MANVDQDKSESKAKADEFQEKPQPTAMIPQQQGGGRDAQEQIRKMVLAGGEAVAKYAKEAGTQADAPTVLDRDELDALVGVEFTILEKTVRQGDFGPYVSLVCLITATDDLVVVNAGGSQLEDGRYAGIPGQLELVGEITPQKPHHVPSGLRRSDYTNRHTNTPSTTYYLDYSDEKSALFARIKSKTKKPRPGQNGTQAPKA